METMGGCSESLTGMPGDIIHFKSGEGVPESQAIRVAGWQPGPKGGKIWSYETVHGEIVPHTSVVKIIKDKSLPK